MADSRRYTVTLELIRFRGHFPPCGERVHHGQATQGLRRFNVSRQTISNWLKQDDLNAGRRTDGLTSDERTELTMLRRENKRLKIEQEILSKVAAWFEKRIDTISLSEPVSDDNEHLFGVTAELADLGVDDFVELEEYFKGVASRFAGVYDGNEVPVHLTGRRGSRRAT